MMAMSLSPDVHIALMALYVHPISEVSNTDAFRAGIDRRDGNQCVVCGHKLPFTLDHCHIVPKTEPTIWANLKAMSWIPAAAKGVEHECRNAVIMCKNHHYAFDKFQYFVRFVPEVSRLHSTRTTCLVNSDSARNTYFAIS
jgi:hypothetical protein